MQIDETIALLQKESRRVAKQDALREEQTVPEQEVKEIKYTVEGLRKGIQKGKVQLGFRILHFEWREFFQARLKIPYILHFFHVIDDSEIGVSLVSELHNVGFTASIVEQEVKRQDLSKWKATFYEAVLDQGLYADIQKEESMEHLDYLCYETPTKEGRLYNVTFGLYERDYFVAGNLSCESEEKEKMGLLLEAIVQEINDSLL